MRQLPVEIQKYCMEALEDDLDALKALRLTAKDLERIATEVLFKKAKLKNEEHSGNKFRALVRSRLSPFIHTVVVNVSEGPGCDRYRWQPPHIPANFQEVAGLIRLLKKLREVKIKFTAVVAPSQYCIQRMQDQCASVLAVVLLPAARRAESITSLTIKNILDNEEMMLRLVKDFFTITRHIKKLHLQVLREFMDPEEGEAWYTRIFQQRPTRSFSRVCLRSINRHLTHLTLYGGKTRYRVPIFMDFRDVPTFPQLKSLSLGEVFIAHDWQIDWITSHKTLKALYMDGCIIITSLIVLDHPEKLEYSCLTLLEHRSGGRDEYSANEELRWHTVFRRFRLELPQLIYFVFGLADWENGPDFETRYGLSNELHPRRYCKFDYGNTPSGAWFIRSYKAIHSSSCSGTQDDSKVWVECDKQDEEA